MNKELLSAVLIYFALISLVTAVVTVADKIKAGKGSFRVPEKTLFILAFLGGSAAEYITMKSIRHKTLHKKFMLGLPLIMIFQLLIIAFVLYRTYFT